MHYAAVFAFFCSVLCTTIGHRVVIFMLLMTLILRKRDAIAAWVFVCAVHCSLCILYGLPGTVCIVLIVNNNSHVFNQRMLHTRCMCVREIKEKNVI